MGRPIEPAVIATLPAGAGRLEHPCPPDPARIATVVAGLVEAFDHSILPGVTWTYRPHPQLDPQPVEEGPP